MKPKASSQGKGIEVISSFDEVPRGGATVQCIVQQYIQNPLLIDNYKFDLRIYVALTSINPLRLYVYEEGLVRFASVPYDTSDLKNIFSHLTNYSINKKYQEKGERGTDHRSSADKVRRSTTPIAADKVKTDEGNSTKHKWSLRTFKEYLHNLKRAGETKEARNLDIAGLCYTRDVQIDTQILVVARQS